MGLRQAGKTAFMGMMHRSTSVGIPQTAGGTEALHWLRILTFICFFAAIGLFLFAFLNESKGLAGNAFLGAVVAGALHLLVAKVRK
jgi:hypothetical protein